MSLYVWYMCVHATAFVGILSVIIVSLYGYLFFLRQGVELDPFGCLVLASQLVLTSLGCQWAHRVCCLCLHSVL